MARVAEMTQSPALDSLRQVAIAQQARMDALRALTVFPELDSLAQVARRNQEMLDHALAPARELNATMEAWRESFSLPAARMVESLVGFGNLSDQINSLKIDFGAVPIPKIAFSPGLSEIMQGSLAGLVSPSGFLGPAVLDRPEMEASLAEFVDEATESLNVELAAATSEPDRLRIFVGWWAGLPPWAQLVLAVLLAWATWGISTELLSEKGILPSLPDLEEERQ